MKNYLEILQNEETLDSPDFEAMRALGKKMIDDSVDYLQNLHKKPVWQEIPTQSKEFLQAKLPQKPRDLGEIYEDFRQHVLPFNGGNIHPRCFSWVRGNGTLTGAFADMLASTMNPNVSVGEQAALYVDAQVVSWAKELMGFPQNSSGILLSGASMANITALAVARNSFAQNLRKDGVQNMTKPMVFYCSSETHSCLQKAAEILGIGACNLRKISVNDDFEMKIDELEATILQDQNSGFLPFCVVANCGAVNTGAIDDLAAISKICKKYNLWFHVDGAFGAAAKLVDEFAPKLKALEEADSLAFDFHKWFYVNYEVACLLVKDAKKHRDSFAIQPDYLMTHERGLVSGPDSTNNFGFELSRNFKALKVWMMFQEHGVEKFKKMIRQNIAQTLYLADLIAKENNLQLLNKPNLNIVCYRFFNQNLDQLKLNKINKELLMRLQEQGIAAPSASMIGGDYVIRVCIVNHRTKKSDLELMVKESQRIGAEILSEFQEDLR